MYAKICTLNVGDSIRYLGYNYVIVDISKECENVEAIGEHNTQVTFSEGGGFADDCGHPNLKIKGNVYKFDSMVTVLRKK